MSFPPLGEATSAVPEIPQLEMRASSRGAGGMEEKGKGRKGQKKGREKKFPSPPPPPKKNKFVVRDLTADAEEREESTRGEMSERRSNMDTNAHTTHTGNNR